MSDTSDSPPPPPIIVRSEGPSDFVHIANTAFQNSIREPWFTKRLACWADLAASLEELTPSQFPYPTGPILFRGCVDESTPLKPSLTQYLDRQPRETALEIELDALKEFRSRVVSSEVNAQLLISDDYDSRFDYLGWWSCMHHYGVPTRLLAWTTSPYIALYHAVERGWGAEDKDGAIYFFNVNQLFDALRMKIGLREDVLTPETQPTVFRGAGATDRLFAFKPKWMTNRMTAQQTLFTVCENPLVDHSDLIHDTLSDRIEFYPGGFRAYHTKLIIVKELKQECFHRLRIMNVTGNSLYPGLDGAGVSVAEFVRLMAWSVSFDPTIAKNSQSLVNPVVLMNPHKLIRS